MWLIFCESNKSLRVSSEKKKTNRVEIENPLWQQL